MKKWLLKNIDGVIAEDLCGQTGLPVPICELLTARGIHTAKQAESFFRGGGLSDPYLIKDMDKAVAAIDQALADGEKITVYGDYDCDGITATVMLANHIGALGGDADWYIPTREEGFGLNAGAVRKIAENGTGLIITVDNGISAVNEAELIYELGMKLVITDHHAVPDILPRAEAVVDPHRKDDTCPCGYLAGCGVALKLIMALENDTESVLEQYADLACIGTIGDSVPLVGENRVIVSTGLAGMKYTENAGLYALIDAARLNADSMTASGVAFGLCPRINAVGRMDIPSKAAELFLSSDRSVAQMRANELCSFNNARKEYESELFEQALAELSAEPQKFNEPVLIVRGEGWKHGVIGLAATRLTERFGKPSIVIGVENGQARGSARSIEGFSIARLFDHCKGLLIKQGGHDAAGGFSIEEKNIGPFCRMVHDYCAENFPTMPVQVTEADKELTADDLDISAVENLKYLQPFGEGNPAPLFLMRECEVVSSRPLKDGKYTSFQAIFKGNIYRFLCFGIQYDDFYYHAGDKVDLLANLEINEYNDVKSVSIRVKEIRRSGIDQNRLFAAQDTYNKILRGEKIAPGLISRVMPTTEEMKLPFDIARGYTDIDGAAEYALLMGINYCKFMMCLHIFAEFGHLKLDRIRGKMEFIKGGKRIELERSAVVKRIKSCCGQG